MIKLIVWGMDGTIADLYGVENWLQKLRSFDPSPYREARPLFDMENLTDLLNVLTYEGINSQIVSWLSRESTKEYDQAVREAKKEWLKEFGFPYEAFHGVKYGATKADSVRRLLHKGEEALLIDDNAKIRAGWHLGPALDPVNDDVIGFLWNLLEGEEEDDEEQDELPLLW